MPLDLKNHKKASLYGYYYVDTFGTHSAHTRLSTVLNFKIKIGVAPLINNEKHKKVLIRLKF